jgi:hypothetical protein
MAHRQTGILFIKNSGFFLMGAKAYWIAGVGPP